MRVKEIMTEDLACCTPDSSLKEAAQMMVDCDCGAIPVVDSEEERMPLGIITDRDIACRTVAEGRNPLDMKVADCMSEGVTTVTADTSVEECCGAMERAQIRRMPVVDEAGRLCGMVSQADVALRLQDESIVGEVVEAVSAPSEHASTLR
jgi:CBS domain-containing protein